MIQGVPEGKLGYWAKASLQTGRPMRILSTIKAHPRRKNRSFDQRIANCERKINS